MEMIELAQGTDASGRHAVLLDCWNAACVNGGEPSKAEPGRAGRAHERFCKSAEWVPVAIVHQIGVVDPGLLDDAPAGRRMWVRKDVWGPITSQHTATVAAPGAEVVS